MKNKTKNIWLYIFIALAIIVGLLFMFFIKPSQQSVAGGGPSGGSPGTTPGTNTHAPCEDCQARWEVSGLKMLIFDTSSSGWQCTGLCSAGTCVLTSGNPLDPYTKPRCDCTDASDTCTLQGGRLSVPTCGGYCVNSNEACTLQLNGECECAPRETTQPLSCNQVTSLSDPSECNKYACSPGYYCGFDTGRGVCVCLYQSVQ